MKRPHTHTHTATRTQTTKHTVTPVMRSGADHEAKTFLCHLTGSLRPEQLKDDVHDLLVGPLEVQLLIIIIAD